MRPQWKEYGESLSLLESRWGGQTKLSRGIHLVGKRQNQSLELTGEGEKPGPNTIKNREEWSEKKKRWLWDN